MLQENPNNRHPNYGSVVIDLKLALEEVNELRKGSGAMALDPGKKIVTTKGKRVSVAGSAETISKVVFSKKPKAALTAHPDRPEVDEETAKAQRLAATGKLKKVAIGIFLAVVLLVGSIFGIVRYAQASRIKKHRMATAAQLWTIDANIKKAYGAKPNTVNQVAQIIRHASTRAAKDPCAKEFSAIAWNHVKKAISDMAILQQKIKEVTLAAESIANASTIAEMNAALANGRKGEDLISIFSDELDKRLEEGLAAHSEAKKALAEARKGNPRTPPSQLKKEQERAAQVKNEQERAAQLRAAAEGQTRPTARP